MSIFRKKNVSYLGVDLGTSNIKMIELVHEGGKSKLSTYGYVEMPYEQGTPPSFLEPKKIAPILKRITQASHVTTRNAVTSLPISKVFLTIMNLPAVSKKDLFSPKNLTPLIRWEAKKFIPLPLEETVLDWQVLSPIVPQGNTDVPEKKDPSQEVIQNTRVLLTATSKELVASYAEIFKLAGLHLLHLETDIFALIRSLIGRDKSTIMVVDIGAKTTNISVVDSMVPYLSKTIAFGGLALTQSIAEKLSIDIPDAEQFKIDMSSGKEKTFPSVLEGRIQDLIHEVNYLITLFLKSHPGRNVEKIILTGGSSLFPSLPEYLSRVLGIRTYLGDPWARILYPEKLRPLLDEIGPKFAVAIGLAMRNITT